MSPIFKKGFSLIEVVVYVALLVILLVAVTASLLSISKTARELASLYVLQNEGADALDRISREIRAAEEVTSGTFDTSPGQLVINTGGLSGGSLASVTIGVDADDNLFIKTAGSATTTLTNRTEARSLILRDITNGDLRAVRLELVLGTRAGMVDKTISLFNTVVLRSSYVQ